MEKRIVKNKKATVIKDLKTVGSKEVYFEGGKSGFYRTIEKSLVEKAIETINTIEGLKAYENKWNKLIIQYDGKKKDTMFEIRIV